MTPTDLKATRRALGLSQAAFARAVGLEGEHADRVVRRWEKGERAIPGPVKVLAHLLARGIHVTPREEK